MRKEKIAMKNIQAQFQMLDNYVKEYSLKTSGKITENMDTKINGQIGFGIVRITTKEDRLIGEIELSNTLEIISKEKSLAQIQIVMRGLFSGDAKLKKSDFEEMLKINGATTLSHLIRAYIHTNTAISGMPNIIVPMINFVQFFKQSEIK